MRRRCSSTGCACATSRNWHRTSKSIRVFSCNLRRLLSEHVFSFPRWLAHHQAVVQLSLSAVSQTAQLREETVYAKLMEANKVCIINVSLFLSRIYLILQRATVDFVRISCHGNVLAPSLVCFSQLPCNVIFVLIFCLLSSVRRKIAITSL